MEAASLEVGMPTGDHRGHSSEWIGCWQWRWADGKVGDLFGGAALRGLVDELTEGVKNVGSLKNGPQVSNLNSYLCAMDQDEGERVFTY